MLWSWTTTLLFNLLFVWVTCFWGGGGGDGRGRERASEWAYFIPPNFCSQKDAKSCRIGCLWSCTNCSLQCCKHTLNSSDKPKQQYTVLEAQYVIAFCILWCFDPYPVHLVNEASMCPVAIMNSHKWNPIPAEVEPAWIKRNIHVVLL